MIDEKKLYLCMGSACYHHGAADVLKVIQQKLRENKLQMTVELMGHFCLGTCNKAVVMTYGAWRFENLTPENSAEIFETEIFPAVQQVLQGTI